MIKRLLILCPAIRWRHSVYSNPFKNSKTHQTHAYRCVCGERLRVTTLCLQPSVRTQLSLIIQFM